MTLSRGLTLWHGPGAWVNPEVVELCPHVACVAASECDWTEVRAGMILVGSTGAGSMGRDASVHAITEVGQIRPAVGTAALAGQTQGMLTMRLALHTGCGDAHVPLHRASASCGRGVRAWEGSR